MFGANPAQCFLKGEYGPHLSYFSSSSGLPRDKPVWFILYHRMLVFSRQLWKVRLLTLVVAPVKQLGQFQYIFADDVSTKTKLMASWCPSPNT